MKREIDIDAARGLMLVWMTLTHLPTAITPWVNQPFGYISASEGFIFLSALFTGRIYYRLLVRDGVEKMGSKLFLRTLKLYGYHVLLLFFAFGFAARYALGANGQGLYNLLDFYFAAGPVRVICDALLLVYRPPLLDIVPLYIIFLLLSPFAIVISARIGWKYILGVSFAFWVLAQFGFREASYAFLAQHFHLQIPLNEMGAFNLWAWQFMWIMGMWAGVCWAKEDLPVEKWARRVWIPAAVVAVLFLSLRYEQIFGLNLDGYAFFLDKWHLGVARIIDFAATAAVVVRFRPVVQRLSIKPLVLFGQCSLQIFCTHFIFCFIGIKMMGDGPRVSGWRQIALIAGTFAALYAVALISSRTKRPKTARQPARPEPRPAAQLVRV
jgi:hypothetical protein